MYFPLFKEINEELKLYVGYYHITYVFNVNLHSAIAWM